VSKWADLLDERLKVMLEDLNKRYAPTRASLRRQMLESGVDPSSAFGGTVLAENLESQQKEGARLGAETAVQKVMLEREDAIRAEQEAEKKRLEEKADKQRKRSMWANVIGTLGGAAVAAIPGAGMAAAPGVKGFLGRFLGGAGGAMGGMAGQAVAGGGASGADMTLTADPEYQALRNQLVNLQLNKEGIPTERFGASVPGKYRGFGAEASEVSPEDWDAYYNDYKTRR